METQEPLLTSPSPKDPQAPLGFLGLGQMGLPIAHTLLRHGYALRVCDPDPSRTALLRHDERVETVERPSLLAFSSHIVCSMVPDDTALQQIVGELHSLLWDGIHLSLSTVSPQSALWAAETYQRAGRSSTYVSATVLGRPPLAEAGALTLLLSGKADAKARVLPLLQTLGRVHDVGERVEDAPLLKLAFNSVIVSALEALGYAASFLRAAQLDPAPALQLLAQTPLFQGVVYDEYGQMIGCDQYEPARFPVPLGLKDVALIMQQSERFHCPMPLVHLARMHLQAAQQAGWEHLDWSVIGRVIASSEAGSQQWGLQGRERA